METKAFLIHMPAEVHRDLKMLAAAQEITMAEIIIEKIKEAISEHKNGDSGD